MNTDQEQEIVRIGKTLEKITHNDLSNEDDVLDLLKALQGCVMSLEILQKSRVGLSVNKIRQKYSGREVASVAKKLIKSWKKLLPAGQVASRESTPKSNKSGSTSPKSAATPTTVPAGPKTNSPPPVTYIQQQSDSSQGSGGEGNQTNGDIPMRRLSSTSDEIILNFASSVDGFSRIQQSTGSDIRDRCRDLLAKALKKGSDEISIVEETQFFNLAAQIEEEIYGEFKDVVSSKYKQKVRSRISNLGDIKNPSLRQNVIWGHITPARIAVMTTDEMASDSMKKLRQQFTKEAIRDAQVSSSGTGTKTDLLKCSRCKKRNCTYTQAQTRSADEPMTTFAYCMECGYRWKFC